MLKALAFLFIIIFNFSLNIGLLSSLGVGGRVKIATEEAKNFLR